MTYQNPFGSNLFDPAPAGHPRPGPRPQLPVDRGDKVNTLATLALVFGFIFARAGAIAGGLLPAAGSQHDAALALTNFILDKIPGPR